MKPAQFTITIRALPDRTDPDGTRRLRAALKCLLRSYRLEVVECAPIKTPEAKEPQS